MNISAGLGVAVREFPLTTGFADYMLYADGKAIGVVEAKPVGQSLVGIDTQTGKYRDGLPKILPHHRLPLPFGYESTGSVTLFRNTLESQSRSRPVFSFHRPEELIRLVGLDAQVRTLLCTMPAIHEKDLWRAQIESIQKLEGSFSLNKPRALIQMATGSGKTFTAVNFCYRLIKFAKARRILFLVDRNNLGRQTLDEFQKFKSPYNGYKFTEEYGVQQLKRNTIDPPAKVCITTIQRLYSMLKGEDEYAEENEEGSLFETESSIIKEPLPVIYNAKVPPETFDFIVVDECHRSIYNIWRQVLEYFDAFLVGLTATPTPQTLGFFNQNLVQEYNQERAIVDRVNVGYEVFRIETEVTKSGAKLTREPGVFVPHRDRRTRKRKAKELDEDVVYTAKQLDRDVVNKNQIRLVIRTFKEKLPEIFPGRTEVPKTLVFAKTDLHADDIVECIREEFGKGNDFCTKITSKSDKPHERLQEFRNAFHPRIAVTVDMIATGTDVKPLECLLFMRDIRSLTYFEQMKGRGCRVIDPDKLHSVTPDARQKTHFVIVDAVGVCESEKSTSKPLDRKPGVALAKLLDLASKGAADADLVSALADRLAKLNLELPEEKQAEIEKAAGQPLAAINGGLLISIDPDANAPLVTAKFQLTKDEEPTEKQLDEVEREQMSKALKPFHNPKLRELLLEAKRDLDQIIDEQTPDKLLRAGFDAAALEKARSMLTSFKKFIEDNKEQIEALQVLYSQPYRAGLKFRHVKELAAKLNHSPFFVDPAKPESLNRLWQAYSIVEPGQVRTRDGKQLVDVIALVRHAIDPNTLLAPVGMTVEERYQQWLAEKQAAGVTFTADQQKWLDAIKDHIASSLNIEREDLEEVPFNTIGGLGRAYELFGDKLSGILDELNMRLAA
jgi:type I restriction enzyme, R subunit